MDTDVLVENKIEDGKSLIRELIREQFAVEVAFWLRRSEESLWELWIGSPAADPRGEAISKVYAALKKIPECSVWPTEINIRLSTDPIVRAAVSLRDRHPSREPKRFLRTQLGKWTAEELCIYPLPFPWKIREVPEGTWQVLISEPDDVWLTCDSQEEARVIAAAPVLQYEALERIKSGEQFAAELEKTAAAMQKHRLGFGSRFLRGLAQDVREKAIDNHA